MIRVKDILKEVPKEKQAYFLDSNAAMKGKRFFNQAREQILNSPVDLAKVIDVEKVDNFLERKFNHLFSLEENFLGRYLLAQAILTNLNQCLKEEG